MWFVWKESSFGGREISEAGDTRWHYSKGDEGEELIKEITAWRSSNKLIKQTKELNQENGRLKELGTTNWLRGPLSSRG